MRTAFTGFLVLSFIGVAVFSMFAMGDGAHEHNGCIAAASQGFDCQANSALSSIALHFDAFRNFSTAVTVALVLVLAAGFNLGIYLHLPKLAGDYYHRRFFESFFPPVDQEFTRWLSLLENSPATREAPI